MLFSGFVSGVSSRSGNFSVSGFMYSYLVYIVLTIIFLLLSFSVLSVVNAIRVGRLAR
jgi:hypothetical protein